MASSAPASPGPTPYTNEIVRRMFIVTADQNYITARWTFLNRLEVDFYWLSLHALEKYLKTILLLNGQSSKGYSHDIQKLYRAVLALDPALSFGALSRPSEVIVDAWRDESLEVFIKRINEQGDPSNRYMTYGYVLRSDDLFKLDQLVWAVRRHCRPFHQTLTGGGQTKEIDWIQDLKNNPSLWQLSGTNPLEKAAAEKAPKELRHALCNMNFPFAPDYPHEGDRIRVSSANPPLADWFMRLKAKQASPDTRQSANDTLQWVLDNIELNRNDRKTLKETLAAYGTKASPAET